MMLPPANKPSFTFGSKFVNPQSEIKSTLLSLDYVEERSDSSSDKIYLPREDKASPEQRTYTNLSVPKLIRDEMSPVQIIKKTIFTDRIVENEKIINNLLNDVRNRNLKL